MFTINLTNKEEKNKQDSCYYNIDKCKCNKLTHNHHQWQTFSQYRQ